MPLWKVLFPSDLYCTTICGCVVFPLDLMWVINFIQFLDKIKYAINHFKTCWTRCVICLSRGFGSNWRSALATFSFELLSTMFSPNSMLQVRRLQNFPVKMFLTNVSWKIPRIKHWWKIFRERKIQNQMARKLSTKLLSCLLD